MRIEQFLQAIAPFERALIYHGVQLRDLETYARFGRIVSRAELFAELPIGYTPFVSDRFDELQEIDESFFANLVDHATPAVRGRGMPNVYGPITLIFPPTALLNNRANEIKVRKKGAFTRDAEGRRPLTPDELIDLYERSYQQKGDGEIEIRGGSLLLADAAYVLVSPITVAGTRLIDVVERTLRSHAGPGTRVAPVRDRWFRDEGAAIYGSLIDWSLDAPAHRGDFALLPSELQPWFDALRMGPKAENLARFSDYLYHGTLSLLRGVEGHLDASVDAEVDFAEPYGDRDVFEESQQLSETEMFERDELLDDLQKTHDRLLDIVSGSGDDGSFDIGDPEADTDERHGSDDYVEAWEEHVAALDRLNEWITSTRGRIESDYQAVCVSSDTAHDSDLAQDLSHWATHFDEIDVPGDLGDRTLLRVQWRSVEHYPESIWDL